MEIVMPSFPFDYESPGKEFDWLLSVFAGILMCRTISLGYFLSDLAMIVWQFPALGGLEFVLHHGLSMFSIFLSLVSSQAQVYILMVLFTESTTPFINLRWYLDVAGQKNSKLYTFNGVALFLMWLVMSTELQTLASLCLYLLNVEHCHMLKCKQMETEPAYTHPLVGRLGLACSDRRGCEDPFVHLLLLPHVYPFLSGKKSVSPRLLQLACSASHAGSDESVLVLENHQRFGENRLEGETP
ncbi:hypothetical protein C3L33_04423, partial [Rhododendron williamsianum]